MQEKCFFYQTVVFMKKQKSLTGYTFAEVVIALALFTMMVLFMTLITPQLLLKLRTTAFKEQAVLLAKSKLEEYIYAPAPIANAGPAAFPAPNERFYYQVTMSAFSSGVNMAKVNVSVWGPTGIITQANINYRFARGLPPDILPIRNTFICTLLENSRID